MDMSSNLERLSNLDNLEWHSITLLHCLYLQNQLGSCSGDEKKGFRFLPAIPAEVKFLGTCIEPKALKKTLLQLSSSKKGILLGCWGLWVQKQQTYGIYPIGSMYAIYGNIYHQYTPNVSIYTIHGSYGYWNIHDGIIWTCLCSMIRIHLLSICHINLLDWTFRT